MNMNTKSPSDKIYRIVIGILSVIIPVAVALLIYMPKLSVEQSWVHVLPHLIGVINTTTTILLVLGFYFIKKKQIQYHKTAMVAAFFLGIIFLVSYIIYHATTESTSYGGEGLDAYFYYFVLISHILLAIVVVPFVLFAFYYAFTNKIDKHKKIVKYAFPVWLYVSVSGVIVYLMISPYY